MLIAGLTGGLASGKSFVAACLRELGCHIIEADALGHAVLQPDGEAYEAVLSRFGTVERSALAALVFNDPEALAQLNAIVHPAVRQRAKAEIARIELNAPNAIVIYVAAILIESGGYRDVDKLILATCPREQQIARAMERPGATEASVLARLANQLPLKEKLPYADYIIDTGGTKEQTLHQTKIVFEDLRRLAS
jgi:dephospho-CoA kinase